MSMITAGFMLGLALVATAANAVFQHAGAAALKVIHETRPPAWTERAGKHTVIPLELEQMPSAVVPTLTSFGPSSSVVSDVPVVAAVPAESNAEAVSAVSNVEGLSNLPSMSDMPAVPGMPAWQEAAASDHLLVDDNSAQSAQVPESAQPHLLVEQVGQQAPTTSSGPNWALRSSFAVTFTYFINYLLLAVVRSKNQYFHPDSRPSANEKILDNVATYLVYVAPMLCVLFYEVAKRFTEPPVWLNIMIVLCSTAFCLQALAYILSELYLKKVESSNQSADQQRIVPSVRFWRNICNLSAFVQYFAVLLIVAFGLCLGDVPLVVGHKCTLILTATYMIVYLMLFILRSHRSEASAFHIEILKHASIAINFAPMLAVLFMATEAALEWMGLAENVPIAIGLWMPIATYAVVAQVVLVSLAPVLADAELRVVGANGELDFVSSYNWVFVLFSILRALAMIVMFIGIWILGQLFWAAEPPKALKVSVYYLSFVYFATYLALWFVIFTDGFCNRAMKVLRTAKDTVAFCPMLCLLFLSVFVQAKQFGDAAVPQSYSEDWMIVGTVGLLVEVAIICAAGYMGKTAGLGTVLLLVFYCALLVVFVSVGVVAVGAFLISTGNATVEGAWFAA